MTGRKSDKHVTALSERDWERFLEVLEEDEPNEDLKQAARRHDELIQDGGRTT